MTPWDTKQLSQLKRLAAEKKSADKIGEIMNRSRQSILAAGKRFNVKIRGVPGMGSERAPTSVWNLPEELQRQAITGRAAAAARRQRQQNEAQHG